MNDKEVRDVGLIRQAVLKIQNRTIEKLVRLLVAEEEKNKAAEALIESQSRTISELSKSLAEKDRIFLRVLQEMAEKENEDDD